MKLSKVLSIENGFVQILKANEYQLSDLAMEKSSIIYDTWNKKNTRLITDDHVLE